MAEVRVLVEDEALIEYAMGRGLEAGEGHVDSVEVVTVPAASNAPAHRLQVTITYDMPLGELTKLAVV